MSGRVHQPRKVETEQIAKHGLRHECAIPALAPEVDGNHRRNDEAEQDLQRDEISERINETLD